MSSATCLIWVGLAKELSRNFPVVIAPSRICFLSAGLVISRVDLTIKVMKSLIKMNCVELQKQKIKYFAI